MRLPGERRVARAARPSHFGPLMGGSEALARLFPLCEKLARSTVPAVIEGETGTGKEVLAEALHSAGPRAQAPFVVFDCTAVPPSMMEAELFGHERGAFTGAVQRQEGVLEQAHGGTLFIDEIGDLDLSLQTEVAARDRTRRISSDRWSRLAQGRRSPCSRPLGATSIGKSSSVAFATTCSIVSPWAASSCRRSETVTATCGSWRCRSLRSWAASPGDLPEAVLARWDESRWSGNVARAAERGRALPRTRRRPPVSPSLAAGAPSSTEAVAAVADRVIAQALPLLQARQQVVDAFEARYLEAMLARHGGVVTKAAAAAGIARRHFQRLRARR